MNCAWWRHQMEPFSVLLALCAGNSPATGEFPAQRPVTRSFDVFFDLRLNERLSKQSWGWWFETPSHTLWRHCDVYHIADNSLSSSDVLMCRWSCWTLVQLLAWCRHLTQSWLIVDMIIRNTSWHIFYSRNFWVCVVWYWNVLDWC